MKEVFKKFKEKLVAAKDKAEDVKYRAEGALGKVTGSRACKLILRYATAFIAFVMLVLSVSLPLVRLNSGSRYTLFAFAGVAAAHGNWRLSFIASVNILVVAFSLFGLVFYAAEEFLRKNKKHIYWVSKVVGICLFILSFALIGTLLCYKMGIEEAGLDEGFMMKQLGFAYIALFICAIFLTFKFFRRGKLAASYIVLITMSIIWILPLLFIVFTSFRAGGGFYTDSFVPDEWSFEAYVRLFKDNQIFMFGRWFLNTLIVAVSTCVLSTFIIVSISYVLSRFQFKTKRLLTSVMLVLGMFPGFMSMIAIYYIVKSLGLSESLVALILCYSGGSAMGYYVVRGFMDTIPRDIDEAAMLDGASKLQIFFRMILPLSKPIIIYTVLTSFMSPWGDYIFASVILGDNYGSYTVALGLYMMLQNSYINSWYTSFAAGAVLVALPISILFIALNKYYVEGLSGSVKG